ncbi:MAG TPA: CHRD domain-containing protein [Vicinamibacterales bacterium]
MRHLLAPLALGLALIGTGHAQSNDQEALLFMADMQGRFVAPAAVETAASARASAVLIGNRFTVHGSFTGLSSALRDINKKPEDPGVHLHRGAPGVTTPYFHGLQVALNDDERSGIFHGVATLTNEQKQAVLGGEAYVDIHTVTFGPGEVRGQWTPVDPKAAARLLGGLEPAAPIAHETCHR